MKAIPIDDLHDTPAAEPDEPQRLLAFWKRHLPAQRTSARTIDNYVIAAGQLRTFLLERGMPIEPTVITRVGVTP